MNIVKFIKIDYVMTKSQRYLMILFALVSIVLSVSSKQYLYGIGYLCFGALIISTIPFILQQNNNCGFINLLPATTLSRVIGRYMFGMLLILAASAIGIVCTIITCTINHTWEEVSVPVLLMIIAAAVIINTVQYIVYYAAGNLKSQQVMALMRMIPAFLYFFGGTYVLSFINKNMEKGIKMILWLEDNLAMIAAAVVAAAGMIFCIGIAVSYAIIRNRDME